LRMRRNSKELRLRFFECTAAGREDGGMYCIVT
jgi:hypothetical protein